RASTWPRDHFCRSTIAPRSSWPTTWNEFLPISMPITAIALSNFWDMACSLSLAPLPSILSLVGQGERPDNPFSSPPRGTNGGPAAQLNSARRGTGATRLARPLGCVIPDLQRPSPSPPQGHGPFARPTPRPGLRARLPGHRYAQLC